MPRILPLVCLLMALGASVGRASPEANAQMVQQDLPALVGRAVGAEAAVADREAFFRGESTLLRAFPDLALSPLFQPGFVADARRGLLAGAQSRAAARLATPPADLSALVTAQWLATWDRVHHAEDRRDALAGRLLAAAAAGLIHAPELSKQQSAESEAGWAAAMSAGSTAQRGTPAARQASVASDAAVGLARMRAAALRQMAIPGDGALSKLIAAELSIPVPGDGTVLERSAARARLDRVRWAAPLLRDGGVTARQADALVAAMGLRTKEESLTDSDVVLAQRAAELAQARAAEAETAEADLQSRVASLRVRIAAELQAESVRQGESLGRLESLEAQVQAHRSQLGAAQAPLVSDRQGRIDEVLRGARSTVAELRAERASLAQLAELAASRELDSEMLGLEAGTPTSSDLSAAAADYRAVQGRVSGQLEEEVQRVFGALREAKQVRDRAYRSASGGARHEVPSAVELAREAREIPAMLRLTGQDYLAAISSLPARVVAVHTLGQMLVLLAKFAILFALWRLVRRKADEWITAGLASIDPRSKSVQRPWQTAQAPSWMVAGEVSALRQPLCGVVIALADVLLAGSLYAFFSPQVPILALIALMFLVGSAARLVPRLVSLVLITPSQVRPGLRVTTVGVRDRARWTARILVVWWGLDACLVYATAQVLDAPRMAAMVHMAAILVLGVLLLTVLLRWAPQIRAKISADGDPGSLNHWISAPEVSQLGAILRSAVGAIVLLAGLAVRLLTLIINGRGGLGWLSAALARRQLNIDDDFVRIPLPAAHTRAVRAQASSLRQPPPQVDRIVGIFADWEGEHRQGMVALGGDRGTGKSRVLAAVGRQLEESHRVVEIGVSRRMTTPDEALIWLAESVGLEDIELPVSSDLEVRAEAVGAALRALPETVFLVDDTHRLFLRSVGCFDALRAVLVAMQESSSHHFWLCSFHGPAFSFLDGVQAISHLAVFRARIEVEPASAAVLRGWLEAATAAAGPGARYDVLLQAPGTGAHLKRMLDRTSGAYWRLLAEASQGNPDVALDYWLTGLSLPSSPDVNAVDVGLFSAPETEDLEALGDGALFALTSLIIHDGATLDELHASLNLPEGEVRGTCRSLEAMGIIADEDGDETFDVTNRWLPVVERLLRRKSFLHRR